MTDLSDPRVPGGGAGKQVTLGGTTNSSGESAGLVVSEQKHRYISSRIQPQYGGANAGMFGLDGGTTPIYLLGAFVSVNPADAIAAENDLAVYGDSVHFVDINKPFNISLPSVDSNGADAQITDLYIAIVGASVVTDATRVMAGSSYMQYGTGAATVGGEAFIRVQHATPVNLPSASQWGDQMLHLTFASSLRITDVELSIEVPKFLQAWINPVGTTVAAGTAFAHHDNGLSNIGIMKVHGYSRV